VSHSHLHLDPVTAKAFRFLLRPGWVIAHSSVRPAMVKADCPAASQRPVREKGSRQAVVADFFAARSLPGIDRSSLPFDLCHSQIGFVTADLSIAAAVGLFAVAGPDPVAVAGFAAVAVAGFAAVVVVGFAAAVVDSACFACSSAAVTGKGRVVALLAFCFLVLRSSSLRTRSFLLLLCFAVPA